MGKRAAFRLQPVLELRRTQERAAAQAAASAANAAADADRQATERETALAGAHPPESASPARVRRTRARLRRGTMPTAAPPAAATSSDRFSFAARTRRTRLRRLQAVHVLYRKAERRGSPADSTGI